MSTTKTITALLLTTAATLGLTGCDTGLSDPQPTTGGVTPIVREFTPNRCGGNNWSGEPGEGKVIMTKPDAMAYLHDHGQDKDGLGDHQAAIDEAINGAC